MKSILTFSVLLAAAVTLSACATVTRGSTEDVRFTSNPSGAKVTTTLGAGCQTPCALKFSRRDTFTATFELEGETREVFVGTEVAGGGVAATAGNVLLGGVIGVGVDVATGAGLDHTPNPVHADFTQSSTGSDPAQEDKIETETPTS